MMLVDALATVAFGLEQGELVGVAVFGIGGLVAVAWGALHFRDGYAMWTNDPVDAAQVRYEDGVVEVTGTANPLHDTIEAPYSNESCLAYEYKRKERRDDHAHDDDDTGPDWRTVDSGSSSVPFVVEDESGTVAVDPEGADISMDDTDYSSRTRTKRLEGRLDVGETVHVFGHHRQAAEGDLADEPVHIGDGDQVNFRIADTSGGRAVLRVLAKGAGSVVFGAIFVGVAGFILLSA